jgi:hypothetical protein
MDQTWILRSKKRVALQPALGTWLVTFDCEALPLMVPLTVT